MSYSHMTTEELKEELGHYKAVREVSSFYACRIPEMEQELAKRECEVEKSVMQAAFKMALEFEEGRPFLDRATIAILKKKIKELD